MYRRLERSRTVALLRGAPRRDCGRSGSSTERRAARPVVLPVCGRGCIPEFACSAGFVQVSVGTIVALADGTVRTGAFLRARRSVAR